MTNSKLKIITWKEVRVEIKKINSTLVEIIDALDCKEEIKLCKADYPFGAAIFKKGILFVPNEKNHLVAANDPTISNQYKKYFDHSFIPFGMVLRNSMSGSFAVANDSICSTIFYPGQIFGLQELFDSEHSLIRKKHWNLFAGARTIFSTVEDFDRKKYQYCQQRFGLTAKFPTNLQEHFFLFRDLLNHPYFSCQWSVSLLFFDKYVRDRLHEKNLWSVLQPFFLKHTWEQSIGWRFDMVSGVIWQRILATLKTKGLRSFGYQAEILKQIIRVALGYAPCFVTADQTEMAAPLTLLREILIAEYQFKSYPIIMIPGYLAQNKYHSGYYPINDLIFNGAKYRNSNIQDTLKTIKDVQTIYQYIRDSVLNNEIQLGSYALQKLFTRVKLSFFHAKATAKDSFFSSINLFKKDFELMKIFRKRKKRSLPFDYSGSFFKGVIKIELDNFH